MNSAEQDACIGLRSGTVHTAHMLNLLWCCHTRCRERVLAGERVGREWVGVSVGWWCVGVRVVGISAGGVDRE